ncbi:sugar phosphate isomerase/epimerase family protein [Metabacillus sp. Hm71]|uniref:sugar phosphate isomerase/epimerase family protein n=1 Tax=Metabacillus sp. Hm71 TaxID=3450743 RepID=UPI003F43C774
MFPYKIALNTSTLMPFQLNVKEQIDIAKKAGYEGIELWVSDIEAYIQGGGTVKELKSYIDDTGILLVNAITFFKWSDADETIRQQGFEQAKREMQMLADLGCQAVTAPPFGNVEDVSLKAMAHYFSNLIELARDIGIEPYLEFWGKARKLSKLYEAMYIVLKSGVNDAKMLIDSFHMYTGGSDFDGLKFLNGDSIGIVHVNDYPSFPSREEITDQDRLFPGDGILPTEKFAKLLSQTGYNGFLSLELFVQNYGGKSALDVALYGLKKVKDSFSFENCCF